MTYQRPTLGIKHHISFNSQFLQARPLRFLNLDTNPYRREPFPEVFNPSEDHIWYPALNQSVHIHGMKPIQGKRKKGKKKKINK